MLHARSRLLSLALPVQLFVSEPNCHVKRMECAAQTLDDLLRAAVLATREGSIHSATRGTFRELRGATLRLTNPRARVSWTDMKGTIFSALGELLWYLSGREDVEFIQYYVNAYKKEAEKDGTVAGAYGPRLVGGSDGGQLAHVISILREKPSTRRAVIQLFDRKDIATKRQLDVPCTCVLQFLIRNDHLDLIAFMRSSDVYLGLSHDIFAFTMLQEMVAVDLGVSLGEYIHMAGSLHLYEEHLSKSEAFLSEDLMPERPMPEMPTVGHWESIRILLAVEADARTNPCNPDLIYRLTSLDPYWQDLGILIIAFSACKQHGLGREAPQRTLEALALIKAHAATDFYQSFLLRKVDNLRRRLL